MTEKELGNYKFLIKERERLHNVEKETANHEYVAYKAPIIDGLPRGNTASDTTCYTALNTTKEKESWADGRQFLYLLSSIERRVWDIEDFIINIPDDRTRLIFQYKFVDDMTYTEIGETLHYSKSSIEKIIKSYIKSGKIT